MEERERFNSFGLSWAKETNQALFLLSSLFEINASSFMLKKRYFFFSVCFSRLIHTELTSMIRHIRYYRTL
jgi:hypothetical protein